MRCKETQTSKNVHGFKGAEQVKSIPNSFCPWHMVYKQWNRPKIVHNT